MWCRLDFLLSADAEKNLFRGASRSQVLFRKTLAALDTQYRIGLPPEFFGYGSDGKPDSRTEITTSIGTTANGLSITAIGAQACSVLRDRSGAINAALMHAAQALVPMHCREGEHTANFIPVTQRFYIANLAVGKSKADTFWVRAADAVKTGSSWMAEADRKIQHAISRGLMRQAVFLVRQGDDLDGNVEQLLAQSESDGKHWRDTGHTFGERLKVKLLGVGGHTFASLGEHRGHRLVLRGVEFTMQGDFHGPWYVGRLKIESQGLIIPSNKSLEAA